MDREVTRERQFMLVAVDKQNAGLAQEAQATLTTHVPNAGGLCVGCYARQVVDQGRGDDVEERDPPMSAPARAWRPRPTAPEVLDDARTVLVVHRLDPRTGRCAACAADCPCLPALDAGRVLAEAGAWNTVPFAGPAGRRAGREGAEGRWARRLVRRLPWTAAR